MISELIDSNVMPGIQGGPLMHIIAAKAVAFGEALKPEFKSYCKKIVKNAKKLAESLIERDFQLVTNGTDTHVILIDLRNKNISGKKAERLLEEAGITTNKNMVPFDERSPMITSGLRVGTPAMTTRGMSENEMEIIGELISQVIENDEDENVLKTTRSQVTELCNQFPLYEYLRN
tara:strand:- start:47 stop:574 length:528 start_codon:yes stop_codon:yes gene_type:complete